MTANGHPPDIAPSATAAPARPFRPFSYTVGRASARAIALRSGYLYLSSKRVPTDAKKAVRDAHGVTGAVTFHVDHAPRLVNGGWRVRYTIEAP